MILAPHFEQLKDSNWLSLVLLMLAFCLMSEPIPWPIRSGISGGDFGDFFFVLLVRLEFFQPLGVPVFLFEHLYRLSLVCITGPCHQAGLDKRVDLSW